MRVDRQRIRHARFARFRGRANEFADDTWSKRRSKLSVGNNLAHVQRDHSNTQRHSTDTPVTSRVGSTCGDDVVREVVGFGFDRDRERFFWLAALGGSGIMAAPH